jgi:hypothetical protein
MQLELAFDIETSPAIRNPETALFITLSSTNKANTFVVISRVAEMFVNLTFLLFARKLLDKTRHFVVSM